VAAGALMAAVLETVGLTRSFGALAAVSDITVRVDEDSVVGLIGGNGAGKTTFLNLITGYLKPTAGRIVYRGRDITSLSPRQVTHLGICRSFQIPQVFDSLNVSENLLVGIGIAARDRPDAAEGSADALLARFHLERYRLEIAGVLPEGVRKLLDIAMALVAQPAVLLLDEPTSGVSADEKFALMDLVLGAIRKGRVTVLFVEHDMEIVRRYAQRILAFHEGRVIADGAPAEVLGSAEVRRLIVGEEPRPAASGG
jgi:branched-chain amino acid transport system ATP-binding protein